MLAMVSDALPILVSVIELVALLPTAILPKLTLLAEKKITGAGVSVLLPPEPLLLSVELPLPDDKVGLANIGDNERTEFVFTPVY